jgi:hypothetical protein
MPIPILVWYVFCSTTLIQIDKIKELYWNWNANKTKFILRKGMATIRGLRINMKWWYNWKSDGHVLPFIALHHLHNNPLFLAHVSCASKRSTSLMKYSYTTSSLNVESSCALHGWGTTGLGLVVRTHGPRLGGCGFHSPCRRGAHHHSSPNYDGGSLDLVVWVPQSPLGRYHVRYFQGTSG